LICGQINFCFSWDNRMVRDCLVCRTDHAWAFQSSREGRGENVHLAAARGLQENASKLKQLGVTKLIRRGERIEALPLDQMIEKAKAFADMVSTKP
jgi:hypothetical protein